MKNTANYIWAFVFLLAVLVVDAYYQIQESLVPIWQTNWFLWRMLGLFAILIVIALYFFYKMNLKKKHELSDYKVKLMESQESEWKRLAGELHDSVGQNLSAINIYLQQNIKSLDDNPSVKENLQSASEMLLETLEEVRRISSKLYPQQIERLGLTVAVQSMISRLSAPTGIKFEIAADNIDGIFPKETEIYFYRIIQEALNNIIKHAGAANVKITVVKALMFVTVDIDDDGKGFDTEKLKSAGKDKLGFGLLNLDERIRLIKGTYEYKSAPGSGTNLHIVIPVK